MRFCFVLVIFCSVVSAQSLEGDVVDAVTRAPVAGAYVSCRSGGSNFLLVRTDEAGHFHCQAAGQPTIGSNVRVSRTGYLNGASMAPASPTVRIELVPEAIIAGTIHDEDGFPVAGSLVQAVSDRTGDNGQPLRTGAVARSNDLGQYRIGMLPAGRYKIQASPGDLINWDRRYVTMYSPGTLELDEADVVEVKAGEEREAADVQLTRHEGASVEGRISYAAGVSPPRAAPHIAVVSAAAGALRQFSPGSLQDDGSFVIPHVPPGNYTLRAETGNYPPKPGDLMAEQPLQVGEAGLRGIVLTLEVVQPVDLHGVLAAEGSGRPEPLVIGAFGMSAPGIIAHSDEDGSFVLKGLLPGHYRLQIQTERPMGNGFTDPGSVGASFPTSAVLGGKEVLRDGFDVDGPPPGPLRITLARPAFLTGTLEDAAGRPVAGARLLLVSSRLNRRVPATTDSGGIFLAVLPFPGDYRVYATTDTGQISLLNDADYQKAHAEDFPLIHVAEGGTALKATLRMLAR